MPTTLIWFRQDLRLCDHRPLTRALELGHDVVCCYVYDQTVPGRHRIGGASRWWLHHALVDLNAQLKALGGKLILRQGSYTEVLAALISECGADALYFSRNYEPFMQGVEQELKAKCDEHNITVRRFAGNILFAFVNFVNDIQQPGFFQESWFRFDLGENKSLAAVKVS